MDNVNSDLNRIPSGRGTGTECGGWDGMGIVQLKKKCDVNLKYCYVLSFFFLVMFLFRIMQEQEY